MSGRVLRETTVGFVGYGAIARQTAVLCKSLGMRVAASLGQQGKRQQLTYRTTGSGDPEGRVPDQWFALDELPQVVGEFDWIVLGLRMDATNRHLVDANLLERCKPGAVLVNPARGGLIDDAALIAALKEGRLGGAALDVYHTEPLPADDPLRFAPNLLLSPHCAPESPCYRAEIVNLLAQNLQRFAVGEPLLNVIRGR